MSSPSESADALPAARPLATADYRAQLDTLVSLLQVANAVPEMADAVLLGQMVETLQTGAANAPLPGVADLLRSWMAALQDLGRRGDALTRDDLIRMSLWFIGLQEHLAGRLDRDGRRMLAQLPDDIRWLPRLSPSFVHVIARRLDQAASEPANAAQPIAIAATDAVAAPRVPDAFTVAADTARLFVESSAADPIARTNPDPVVTSAASAIGDTSEDIVADSNGSEAVEPDAIASPVSSIEADAFVPDDAPAAGTGPIWIGREELDLTRQAILEQVLPLTQTWSDAMDTAAADALIEELGYQCQLIVNVMELIGTLELARGMDLIREGLERREAAIGPEALAIWCNALLAAFEQPGREAADLLVATAPALPALDARWSAALGDELARVAVGFDPALIAQRKTVAGFEDIGLTPANDVLPSVLDGMYRELPGNTARLGDAVRALAATRSPEPIDEARRVAHTLKGDANTVGIRGLANLTHALEDILIALAKRPDLLDDDCAELLTAASDCVEEISDHLLGRGPAPDDLLDLYQRVLDAANALADGAQTPQTSIQHAPADIATASTPAPTPSLTPASTVMPAASTPALPAIAGGMAASGIQSLNVPSALLDELQRLAGETLVTSRQIDQQLEGLGTIHRDQRQGVRYTHELMGRLDDLVALRGAALQSTAQKAGADLDPLEIDQYNELHVISRQLLEAHADSGEFMRRIDRIMNALSDLRSEQEQLNRDLQRTILRTRTVPFGQISQRLQRIVRQTAKQVFKQVELDIVGEDIPVDAELLERIVEPLAHLLRNAIDHGIEAPEARIAAGKPDTGRIMLRVGLQGDAATIELQDDGRGLDLDAIRARGIAAGLIDADQPADERLLTRLILLPGFSTRSSASDVSGRGIGMDVVNQRIAALRGTLTLSSQTGHGTRVLMRLPVTQTLANVIVARGQRQVSAVVAASVERVVSFAAGECRYDDGHLTVALDGTPVPALPIEAFYGDSADISMWLGGGIGLAVRDPDGRPSVVLVRSIDEVRSVVVKPMGAYLPPVPAVRGITQLGDGGLAPVIDLDVLLQSSHDRRFDTARLSVTAAAAATRVVVADDSLSVRRALEQLMQDAGFEVATARDGFEALAAIQAKPTHALLVDLEMPRMNGLEVARNLRNQASTRDLPVVMITSRATDKHQAMAEQAGVTRLLGKPFSEDTLVALVRSLIAERASAEAASG
ncbi:hybrid sensor histidine kinase/response regulator [Lysobacter hankyongensis]|uniref:histidine kinase n=1 Tax=Lysobacter hankyongensis TaxID=1176535 RepID=A0ABP9BAH4_9GAMM